MVPREGNVASVSGVSGSVFKFSSRLLPSIHISFQFQSLSFSVNYLFSLYGLVLHLATFTALKCGCRHLPGLQLQVTCFSYVELPFCHSKSFLVLEADFLFHGFRDCSLEDYLVSCYVEQVRGAQREPNTQLYTGLPSLHCLLPQKLCRIRAEVFPGS